MKMELIYTFDESEQEIIKTEVPVTFLEHKEKLSEYLTRRLTIKELDDLVKISCCAFVNDKNELPGWFLDCNGKLWFN